MNAKGEYKFEEDELDEIYSWVDGFRLSREKRNISRDFSDSVLIAEIVKSVDPSLVDLKQLVETLNTATKRGNWETLNRITFSKMGFRFSDEDIDAIVNCKPLAAEHALRILKVKIERYIQTRHDEKMQPNQDQMSPLQSEPPRHPASNNGLELPAIKTRGTNRGTKRAGSGGYENVRQSQPQLGKAAKIGDAGSPVGKTGQPRNSPGRKGEPLTEVEKKDEIIKSLEYRVDILQMKITKLEQLLSLKDHKIQYLESGVRGGGGN